jgi:hypothetical protein
MEELPMPDYLPDDLRTLWKELNNNPVSFSPDQLQNEMWRLQRGLLRRTALGGAAALIVAVGWGVFFFQYQNLLWRIGSILTVVAAGYIIGQIIMRYPRSIPEFGETTCIQFYRAELERQRDFHRGRWLWSRLLIFLPGPFVWFAGFAQTHAELAPFIYLELAAFLILLVIAVPLNLKLARKYQLRIDALDTSQRSP